LSAIKAVVAQAVESGDLVHAEIAGCSPRTLAEEGVSYERVIDTVRCNIAMAQRRDNEVSVESLSRRLRYSKQLFMRAFCR
jgi:hypothetical protein